MPGQTSTLQLSRHKMFVQKHVLTVRLAWVLEYAGAFTMLAVFRLCGLTHQSLWFDEGYTLHLASAANFHDFLASFGSYTTSEHLQPLFYFVMFAWSRVADTSDTALRLPSALFSIGSGLCLYNVLRNLSGRANRASAIIGLGLFSMCSYSIYYAQEARPYACVQFFSFLVLAVWLRTRLAKHEGTGVSYMAAGWLAITCTLASFASVFGFVAVFSLSVADLVTRRRTLTLWWQTWWPAALLTSTCVLLYSIYAKLAFSTVVAKDIVLIKQPLWMNAAYTAFGLMFGTTLGPSSVELHGAGKAQALLHALPILIVAGLTLCALGFAVLCILRLELRQNDPTRVVGLAAAIYGVVLFLGFGLVGKLNILPRHASALFALITLVVAGCALHRTNESFRGLHLVVELSLAAAFLLNSASVMRSIYAADCRKDDYRAVAGVLPHDGEPVYMAAGQTELLQHYGFSAHSAVDVPPEHIASYLQQTAPTATPIRIVTNTFRNFRWDGQGTVEARLEPAYICREEHSFAYFQILQCASRRRSYSRRGTAGVIDAR